MAALDRRAATLSTIAAPFSITARPSAERRVRTNGYGVRPPASVGPIGVVVESVQPGWVVQVAGESPLHGVMVPPQLVVPNMYSQPSWLEHVVSVRFAQGVSVPLHVAAPALNAHPSCASQAVCAVSVLHAVAVPVHFIEVVLYLQPISLWHPVWSSA